MNYTRRKADAVSDASPSQLAKLISTESSDFGSGSLSTSNEAGSQPREQILSLLRLMLGRSNLTKSVSEQVSLRLAALRVDKSFCPSREGGYRPSRDAGLLQFVPRISNCSTRD